MAIFSLYRLKIPSLVTVGRTTRSSLIKQDSKVYFSTNKSTNDSLNREKGSTNGERHRCDTKERNMFVNTCYGATKRSTKRRAILLDDESQFLPSSINHSWNFSKELCPSAGYHSLSMKKLSNSMLKFHSTATDSFDQKCSYESTRKDSGEAKYDSKNVRNYSSEKGPTSGKTTKSDKCPNEKTDKAQEASEGGCSNFDETENLCSKSERPCPVSFEDVQAVCKPIACPDIRDYCPPEAFPVGRRQAQLISQPCEKSDIPAWLRGRGSECCEKG